MPITDDHGKDRNTHSQDVPPEAADGDSGNAQISDKQYPSLGLLARIVDLFDELEPNDKVFKPINKKESTQSEDVEQGQAGDKAKSKGFEAGKDRRSYYKDLDRVADFLGRSVLEMTSGQGAKASDEQLEYVAKMREIVRLVKELRDSARKVRVRVATSPLLSVRVLGPLIARFNAEVEKKLEKGQPRPEIEVTLMSPKELDEVIQNKNNFDIIFSFTSKSPKDICGRTDEEKSKPELYRPISKPIYRALIVRRGSDFTFKYRKEIEEGRYSHKMLDSYRVALMPPAFRLHGFPSHEIAKHARVVTTNSSLESHAQVRVGNADLTFTHLDVLSPLDLRALDYIDLGRCGDKDVESSLLTLIRGGRKGSSKTEISYSDELWRILKVFFDNIEARHERSSILTASLREYCYSYHSTFVPVSEDPGGRPKPTCKPTWVRGEFDLAVCVQQREDPKEITFVGGKHRFEGPKVSREFHPFFGRISELQQNSPFLLWRSTLSDHDATGFSIDFIEGDLAKCDVLCGTWAGKPSWMGRDEVQVFGFMILAKEKAKKLNKGDLEEIVKEYKRRAGSRFANLNPLDNWTVPQDIHGD